MVNGKWDKKTERTILRLLDGMVRKYGIRDARHAVNKWNSGQGERAAIAKAQREVDKRLAILNARLRGPSR